MAAYYNEIDPYAAQWLRNLIDGGHITAGEVDERSIEEVQPDDLKEYERCHFFAGIAGWDIALNLAGWGDAPVWTGSCPCQPFSSAGKQRGADDERHLWPAFYRLVAECEPPTVFGEQVASKDGREWLAAVRLDLEDLGYACGSADLCAAGVGAPHIRQRLFWVAHSDGQRLLSGAQGGIYRGEKGAGSRHGELKQRGSDSGLAYCASKGWDAKGRSSQEIHQSREIKRPDGRGDAGGLAYAAGGTVWNPGQPWASTAPLECTDGKIRFTEPGVFPLAHGVPARVGRLRAYGNAIVPQVAAEFVAAFLECRP